MRKDGFYMKKTISIILIMSMLLISQTCLAYNSKYLTFVEVTKEIENIYLTLIDDLNSVVSSGEELTESEVFLYFAYAYMYMMNKSIETVQSASATYDNPPEWVGISIDSNNFIIQFISEQQDACISGEITINEAIENVQKVLAPFTTK